MIQYEKDGKQRLNNLYQRIDDLTERVVPLYDDIEGYFFQDIEFRIIEPILPKWISDAGRSPESAMSKIDYEKLRQIYNDELSNRIIHWYDVQTIIAALQDRWCAIKCYMTDIYTYVPAYCKHQENEYTACYRGMDETATKVHTAINNVFVSLASSFDLFAKIAYECAKYNPNVFVTYKRLRSRTEGILYSKSKCPYNELKKPGLLYSEPACVRTVCSFRDEFIHNGAWDYRCAIYYPSINGEPIEPFVLMPDVDENGLLVSSGSRNKFYSIGDKVNVVLPGLVNDVVEVMEKSVGEMRKIIQGLTGKNDKTVATDKAIEMLESKYGINN